MLKKGNNANQTTPALIIPLSELMNGPNYIPVGDIDAWVCRPASDRQREARQRRGHITRPLNSFMLYRSAYIERAKAWCLHNKQTILSSVIAESWLLEWPQIRNLFAEYARLEKINHQAAFPTYVFSPGRAKIASRKMRRECTDQNGNNHPPGHYENAICKQAEAIQQQVFFTKEDILLGNPGWQLTSDNPYFQYPFGTEPRTQQTTFLPTRSHLLQTQYNQHINYPCMDLSQHTCTYTPILSTTPISNIAPWGGYRASLTPLLNDDQLLISVGQSLQSNQAHSDAYRAAGNHSVHSYHTNYYGYECFLDNQLTPAYWCH
jgi:hypothetical protein